MTIYKTTFYGDIYRISANFSEASDNIMVEGDDGKWMCVHNGMQVANYRHSPQSAMRDLLEHCICEGGGKAELQNEEVVEELNDAISAIEIDSEATGP